MVNVHDVQEYQLGIWTSSDHSHKWSQSKRIGPVTIPTMGDRVYAKSFRATPTNVAPATSIPRPSNDALWAAPVEPEEVVPPEDADPVPVAPAAPFVGDATLPLTVVVPLMSGQVSIHTYERSNVCHTLFKWG
jgi:hypothetical protein